MDGLAALGRAEAHVRTARLVALDVGDRRHLEPALLAAAPHLEVVGLGLRHAHVARRQDEPAVGEAQRLHAPLGSLAERFEAHVAGIRVGELDELDLVELVEPVEAAHVLAVRAGLAPEAGRVGGVADRELSLGQDLVAAVVDERHLGRGHEVETVALGFVHLALFVGQLPGPDAAGLVDEEGRLDLGVAGLGREVEEQADERALEARPLADVEREAGAGHLRAALEVEKAEAVGELPVGEGREALEGGALAPRERRLVRARVADRRRGVGRVGDGEEGVSQARLGRADGLVELGDLGLEAVGLLQERRGLVALAGLHQRPDPGAERALLLLERLLRRERRPALRVELDGAVDERRIAEAFVEHALAHAGGVVAEKLEVDHREGEGRGAKLPAACRRSCDDTAQSGGLSLYLGPVSPRVPCSVSSSPACCSPSSPAAAARRRPSRRSPERRGRSSASC